VLVGVLGGGKASERRARFARQVAEPADQQREPRFELAALSLAEEALDAGAMTMRALQQRCRGAAAALGQVDKRAATVGGGRPSLDKLGPLHPVDRLGEGRLLEEDEVGELVHGDAVAGGERGQHPPFRRRKPLPSHLLVKPFAQKVVGARQQLEQGLAACRFFSMGHTLGCSKVGFDATHEYCTFEWQDVPI
jgi:hypothetical protein